LRLHRRCRWQLYGPFATPNNGRPHAGRGANTFSRRPVALVYQEAVESLSDALKREFQIKNWSRARKDALIARSPLS
jgi:putative endonuclease